MPPAMPKAGVHVMIQCARARASDSVRSAPGPFRTEGASARFNANGDDRVGSNSTGRTGRPEELGNLTVFLLPPGAEFVDGQTIAIDGAAWQATGQNFAALTERLEAQWAATAAAREIDARDKAARG